MRVVGFTATPYRLGHGMITDKPALFDALIEPVSISKLQRQGYLAILRSKVTAKRLEVSDVHTRGGEYIESELQAAVDVHETSEAVVDEVLRLAGDRRAWLVFCTGVKHARNVAAILKDRGIPSACVTGETPKSERDAVVEDFRNGVLRAVTNANVLTTGFDYPDIDLIVMMRPTLSPGLYMQMAGRGLRIKSQGGDCLVLDFAGVVQTHGPITQVKPPKRKGQGPKGVAPCKICPECDEIIAGSAKTCPSCGHEFPITKKSEWYLHDDDISGKESMVMRVSSWKWATHIGVQSGKEMIMVSYYGDLSDPVIREYLTVFHEGYAGQWAMETLGTIAQEADVNIWVPDSPEKLIDALNRGVAPSEIRYRKTGKFYRVVERTWRGEHEQDVS
jgi:DNA repair protein RadD